MQCAYATNLSKNLKTHITVNHQENVLNNSEESYNIFACDICDTSYNCQDDLMEHRNNMHQNYSCNQCDFEACGQMMDYHTSTSHLHFSCDECEFIAKNKGGLTRHRNAKHENTMETKEQNHFNTTTGVEPKCYRTCFILFCLITDTVRDHVKNIYDKSMLSHDALHCCWLFAVVYTFEEIQ